MLSERASIFEWTNSLLKDVIYRIIIYGIFMSREAQREWGKSLECKSDEKQVMELGGFILGKRRLGGT